MTTLPTLRLKPNRQETLGRGHPWVFSGALAQPLPVLEPGTLVDLVDGDRHFLARGYYHPNTDIAIRVLTRDPQEAIDEAFFIRRIAAAHTLRKPILQDGRTTGYRLINAEGDFLPGLIVDDYAGYLVLQVSTSGIDRLMPLVISALQTTLSPRGMLLRNDISVREREGLKREAARVIQGTVPPLIPILENGMHFQVDAWTGQKTGFFLDQRDKRAGIQRYAAGASVLNTFCYTGGFGIAALKAGAQHITSVDQSDPVIAQAKSQMQANGFDPAAHEFVTDDAFHFLERCSEEHRLFDIVILDPPAFAKSQSNRNNAMKAYRRLNMLGARVVRPGGLLLTCSCSGAITLEEFRILVSEGGQRAGRILQAAETYEHGLDHPVLLAMPESRYLKALFCRC